jgi:hypothetical protein
MSGFRLDAQFKKVIADFLLWGLKGGKLSLDSVESLNAFFLGVYDMTILEAVKLDLGNLDDFQNNNLNEVQFFLENCHLNNSVDARISEFLHELSCFKHESIVKVKDNFEIVMQSCIEIIELHSHLYSLITDIQALISSSPVDDNSCILLNASSSDLFKAYLNCFFQGELEYFDYLSNYVNQYWSYSFFEIQSFIKNYSDNHLKHNCSSLEKYLSSDLLTNYYISLKSFTLSVDVAFQNQCNEHSGYPVLRLSDFDLPSNLDHISEPITLNTPLFDTANSLDDILDMVVKDTKHDTVIRGTLIGTELC